MIKNKNAVEMWKQAQAMKADAQLLAGNAIRMALAESGWLTSRAARLLGLSHSTFRGAVERAGLHWEALQRRTELTGPRGGRPSDTFKDKQNAR